MSDDLKHVSVTNIAKRKMTKERNQKGGVNYFTALHVRKVVISETDQRFSGILNEPKYMISVTK